MSMVISERRRAVTVLTLNNPEKYNALGGSLLEDLSRALDAACSETGARNRFDRGGQGLLLRSAIRREHV